MKRSPFTLQHIGQEKPFVNDQTEIFTRRQCHIEDCWNYIYIDGLCKYHRDLKLYRDAIAAEKS